LISDQPCHVKKLIGKFRTAKSFFKNLKMEWVYHKKYRTRFQAALSIFEYIETWYNSERIHTTLEMSIKDFNEINNEQKLVA